MDYLSFTTKVDEFYVPTLSNSLVLTLSLIPTLLGVLFLLSLAYSKKEAMICSCIQNRFSLKYFCIFTTYHSNEDPHARPVTCRLDLGGEAVRPVLAVAHVPPIQYNKKCAFLPMCQCHLFYTIKKSIFAHVPPHEATQHRSTCWARASSCQGRYVSLKLEQPLSQLVKIKFFTILFVLLGQGCNKAGKSCSRAC